jgi:hypothetical protein
MDTLITAGHQGEIDYEKTWPLVPVPSEEEESQI